MSDPNALDKLIVSRVLADCIEKLIGIRQDLSSLSVLPYCDIDELFSVRLRADIKQTYKHVCDALHCAGVTSDELYRIIHH